MAKENYVFLVGHVKKEPVFIRDHDGNPIEGIMPLTTIRRGPFDEAGNFSPRWDKPILRTKDPRLVKKMESIQLYDVVETKCSIVTAHAERKIICPHCGAQYKKDTALVYLSPISICVRQHTESDTAGVGALLDVDLAEISNVAKIIGRVCNEEGVKYYEDGEGHAKSSYQIAVNRKFYIYGSTMDRGSVDDATQDDRADYPWVTSYGKVAEEDYQQIQQGSLIFIDGYVHTQSYNQKTVCENPECGKEFEYKCQSVTITPYSNEYLEGCKLVDSVRNLSRESDLDLGAEE